MMTLNMIQLLFANFCILTSFVYFGGIFSKRYALALNPLTLSGRVGFGLLHGLFGLILMSYSFPVGPNVFANLRHLTIVLVAAYIGWLPSLICALIIAAGRVLIYGFALPSLTAAASLLLIGVFAIRISVLPWTRLRKMTVLNVIAMILTFIFIYTDVGSLSKMMGFFPLQLVISLAAGFVLYYVAEQVQRSNETFARLEIEAATDYLTGLNNVQQFHRRLASETARAERKREPLALLALDIDLFKQINDTYGHPAGDSVLKQLALRLQGHCREYDVVSRTGGEEFTVLLPSCPLKEALSFGERIRRLVEKDPFVLPSGKKIAVTVSVGVAVYPETVPSPDGEQLYDQADSALYKAKSRGRNTVCFIGEPEPAVSPGPIPDKIPL